MVLVESVLGLLLRLVGYLVGELRGHLEMSARPTVATHVHVLAILSWILVVSLLRVAFVGGLAVASVIIVDHVSIGILRLLLKAFLHHGDLLAEFPADVSLSLSLRMLPGVVLAARHFFFDRLAVLLLLLRDDGSLERSALAVILRIVYWLLNTCAEELDLLALAGRRSAMLRCQVIKSHLLVALIGCEERWELVLVADRRSARGGFP